MTPMTAQKKEAGREPINAGGVIHGERRRVVRVVDDRDDGPDEQSRSTRGIEREIVLSTVDFEANDRVDALRSALA